MCVEFVFCYEDGGGRTVVLVGARFDFERRRSAALQRASSGRKKGKKTTGEKKEEDHTAKKKGCFSLLSYLENI